MNDFSRSELNQLKSQVNLAELMRSHGFELKRVGKNLLTRCPWHDDTEASLVINPEKQLYNCFGCEAKGDVLSFLQVQENLSFPQAVMRLKELAGSVEVSVTEAPKPKVKAPVNRSQYLKRVAEHYRKSLANSPEAKAYLQERGLDEEEMLQAFQVGYCEGSLLKTVPEGSQAHEALTALGVLNDKGREHFLGCIVVPLEDPELGIVGLYGRRLNPQSKVRHLFLPGLKLGVFNHQVLRTASSVFVVEGVLDALSLWTAGAKNVICAQGSSGLPPRTLEILQESQVQALWLCFDADRAGEEAVSKMEEQCQGRFELSKILLPPGTDPNSLLMGEGPASLRSFLDGRQPLKGEPEPQETSALPITETNEENFLLHFEALNLSYEVQPLPPFVGRLRVCLRAVLKTKGGKKRFLDRLDLTSSRARASTVKVLCTQLDLAKDVAEKHMNLIVETADDFVEALQKAPETDSQDILVLSEDEKLQALEFLQQPDLVSRLQDDMEALGYVGETKGKLLAYLVGLSRKLAEPLSAIIRSQSGAGKSGLASLVALLTPPEDVVHYSRVSAHALAYSPRDAFKRKLLLMEERVGSEAADYYLRILQSAQVIRQAVTIKDPVTGQMRTQEFEVEGPMAYIETTTSRHLNQENTSRCFEIFLDESEEQTRRIHQRQREAKSLRALKRGSQQKILERHHNAQRMLEVLKVVIPYGDLLTFPSKWLRTRRDNQRFIALIEASALFHQFQRVKKSCLNEDGDEVHYVEANLEDYRLAYELAEDVLQDTLHELSLSARELLKVARSLDKSSFTRKDLRAATNWPQKRVTENVAELVDMEYLASLEGSHGKTYRYEVIVSEGEKPTTLSGLLSPEALEERLRKEVNHALASV